MSIVSRINLSDAQPSPTAAAERIVVDSRRTERNSALDFTKGALVLFMVLYHWLNYFHGTGGNVYMYLRFLTPSFIFITGFLISNVYLSKYRLIDTRLSKRLIQRGLKILGVFISLNAIIALLFPNNGRISFDVLSLDGASVTFITGNILRTGIGKAAAFPVLVPISYLLLIGAGLTVLSRRYKHVFEGACAFLFVCILVLWLNDVQNTNLELLAIGLLGVTCGYVPIAKINALAEHVGILSLAYLGYLTAITVWNVIYPLQVFGVCLTLMLLYACGIHRDESGLWRHVIVLGKYSLFGYIVQIAIVYSLHKAVGHLGPGVGVMVFSCIAAFLLTMISVELLDRVRKAVSAVDTVYKAVFA